MKSRLMLSTFVLLLGGCVSTDKIDYLVNVDAELERNAQMIEIQKADKFWSEDKLNISAGPYRVSKADRGWKHTSSHDALDWSLLSSSIDNKHYSHQQRVRFMLNKDDGSQWKVRCEKRGEGKMTQFNSSRGSTILSSRRGNYAYECAFRSGEQRWDLIVENSRRFGSKAYFKTPDDEFYEIESFYESHTHPMDNSRAGMLGYYLVSEGENFAAISALPMGKMWLRNDGFEQRQDDMAMASVGLWFYHNGFDDEH